MQGKKEGSSKKMEPMEKTEIVKVLQQLGVCFGNLIAMMENILLERLGSILDGSYVCVFISDYRFS